MIKLIASDLDGTLLFNYEPSISPTTLDLIQALTDQGVHFVVASGRQYANERNLFKSITNPLSYIAENGSLTVHNDEIFSKTQLDRDLVRRICQRIKSDGLFDLLLSGTDTCFIEDKNSVYVNYIVNQLKNNTTVVKDIFEVKDPIIKIAICNMDLEQDEKLAYLKDLNREFEHDLKIVTSGNLWMDFITPGANKGSALRDLMKHLNILPEECMAFGDQFNDVEMLQSVGYSYAISSCAEGVEKYARYTTDSVDKILAGVLEDMKNR